MTEHTCPICTAPANATQCSEYEWHNTDNPDWTVPHLPDCLLNSPGVCTCREMAEYDAALADDDQDADL